MIKYKLFIILKDSREQLEYTINLSQNQENQPEHFFTHEAREQLRGQVQSQSDRRLNDTNLSYIVNNWIRDIKKGYRDTRISLNLPLRSGANIEELSEAGNQELPAVLSPALSSIEPQGGALPPLIFS